MRSIPISAQRAPAADSAPEIDFLKLLTTLRRSKWRIALYTFVAAALAAYYAVAVATPLYTATTTVALESRSRQVVDLASPLAALNGQDFFTINTEIETLRSRDLIAKLVAREDLVADPLFNHRLRPEEEPAPISLGALIGLIERLTGRDMADDPAPPPTEEDVRNEVIDRVQRTLEVTNVPNSYAFAISVTTTEPDASKRVANALAEVYMRDQIDVKLQATADAVDTLSARVADLKAALEKTETRVKEFTSGAELVGPEALAALNRQLKDRRDRADAARENAAALAASVTALERAAAGGDPAAMAAAAGDPALERLLPRLGDEGAQASFDRRFEDVLARTRREAARASAQIAPLDAAVAELEAQVARQSGELLQLEQLERDAAAKRQLYEYFLGRLNETSAQTDIEIADSRRLSAAVAPRVPSWPNPVFLTVAGGFLGFLIGCAAVLTRELRQTAFRSAQEVEQATGLVTFGQIPRAPVTKRRRVLQYLASRPASAFVEAVRNLRTSVLMSNIDSPPKVVMVTSSLPGEGKTTLSLALAQSFAGLGKRVLLIEGDIRRRSFQEYFRIRGMPGLVSAVAGETPLDQAVFQAEELGIDVLPGERTQINAADFFSSERFRKFLENLRAEYDMIVIDTPPVLVVPDARVIGPMADAVLYAVHWDRTTRVQVGEGVHALQSVDVKISGIALCQIDTRKAQAYGGKYGELYNAYGRKYYHN